MQSFAIQSFVLQILLVVAETFGSGVSASRSGWVPIPTIKPPPTASTTPPATSNIFQNATTNLVNSLRASYQAQPVTWNSTLESAAKTCADRQALVEYTNILACDCGGTGAAPTVGFSNMPLPSLGMREVISDREWPAMTTDRSQQLAWYAAFNDVDGAVPPTPCIDFTASPVTGNPLCTYFTQLIWRATTQFGCAYSLGATPTSMLHVLTCCWNPAGNTAADFADNVMNANG